MCCLNNNCFQTVFPNYSANCLTQTQASTFSEWLTHISLTESGAVTRTGVISQDTYFSRLSNKTFYAERKCLQQLLYTKWNGIELVFIWSLKYYHHLFQSVLVWRCYFKMTETCIRERHTIDTHILRLRHFLQLTLKMPAEARRTDSAALVSLHPSIYTHSRSVFNIMCVWAQSVSQAPPTSESYSPCETHQLCLNGPYIWLVDEAPNQQVSTGWHLHNERRMQNKENKVILWYNWVNKH